MTDARQTALEALRTRLCLKPHADNRGPGPGPEIAAWARALRPDGSWKDVVYQDDHLKDWTAALHLRRLRDMAEAWYRPDSPLHRQPALRQAVRRGLDGWYARNPLNPNWWWNQIGAPLLLGETLLFLKGACPAATIERAEPAFRTHEPIIRFTGQNLVWTATVLLYHGILTDSPERASQAFLLIGREIRVNPDGEGIQPDMSFHQHGKLLYSGGYGAGFAADVARFMALSAGLPTPSPHRGSGSSPGSCSMARAG